MGALRVPGTTLSAQEYAHPSTQSLTKGSDRLTLSLKTACYSNSKIHFTSKLHFTDLHRDRWLLPSLRSGGRPK